MDMSEFYKPVFLKAFFEHMDEAGVVRICDLVDYFTDFYTDRLERGLPAEKPRSLFQKDGYTPKDVERSILTNPFKRFADMRFMKRCKDPGCVALNPIIHKRLTPHDRTTILAACEEKLAAYYKGLGSSYPGEAGTITPIHPRQESRQVYEFDGEGLEWGRVAEDGPRGEE